MFAVPFGLILIQPDWGTAFVYAFSFILMLIMAKTSWKIILGIFVSPQAFLFPVAWSLMDVMAEKPHPTVFLG